MTTPLKSLRALVEARKSAEFDATVSAHAEYNNGIFMMSAANFAQTEDPALIAKMEELEAAYHAGMSPEDYQRVQQWIKEGCPNTPETAFTAGPARQAARLVQEALAGTNAKMERMEEALRKIWEKDGEINPASYNQEDVFHLNGQFIDALLIARAALSDEPATKGTGHE